MGSCLLSSFVKFRSTVSEEKWKMSQSIRHQGGHLIVSDLPENKLCKWHWDLPSCQILLNSIQRFQKRSWKCVSQSEVGDYLLFPSGPKNSNLVELIAILLPVQFRWILHSYFIGEVENVSANQWSGRSYCFSDSPEKQKLGWGRLDLLLLKFRWIPLSAFRGEVKNVKS